MNEILKVNSKTDILEFKRKHNLLVESSSVKISATNITTLTDAELNNLRCGDMVQKKTGSQFHNYIVTYKEENKGICLSYYDAGYLETVSYDYTDGHWVYNSTDNYNIDDKIIEKLENGEPMSGYSFNLRTVTGYTIDGVYVGACKNGNKLTLVCAVNITRTMDDLSGNLDLGSFTIPASVGEKLFPAQVGSYLYLVNQNVQMWSAAWSKKDQIMYVNKVSNTNLSINFDSSINTNLVKNTTYYCRIEMTFLLSNNLLSAQQGE